jgi:hypothetical protein
MINLFGSEDGEYVFVKVLCQYLFREDVRRITQTTNDLLTMVSSNEEEIRKSCKNMYPHSFNDIPSVDIRGNKTWWYEGRRYRPNDKPARESVKGHLVWYDNKGRIHREDGPAEIYPNGTLCYWEHGENLRDEYNCDVIISRQGWW